MNILFRSFLFIILSLLSLNISSEPRELARLQSKFVENWLAAGGVDSFSDTCEFDYYSTVEGIYTVFWCPDPPTCPDGEAADSAGICYPLCDEFGYDPAGEYEPDFFCDSEGNSAPDEICMTGEDGQSPTPHDIPRCEQPEPDPDLPACRDEIDFCTNSGFCEGSLGSESTAQCFDCGGGNFAISALECPVQDDDPMCQNGIYGGNPLIQCYQCENGSFQAGEENCSNPDPDDPTPDPDDPTPDPDNPTPDPDDPTPDPDNPTPDPDDPTPDPDDPTPDPDDPAPDPDDPTPDPDDPEEPKFICSNGSVVTDQSDCPVSSVSVSCSDAGTNIDCEGDPINCAILNELARQNCADVDDYEINVEPSQIGSVVTDALGQDSDDDESTIDISQQLDYSGLGWSTTCPAPRAYNLGYVGSIQIDLTPFCTIAEIISFFVMFTSSAISLRILFT